MPSVRKRRKTKTVVLVTFSKPSGIPDSALRDFIIDALETAGGCRNPDDPLFHSLENVRVSKPIVPWRDPALKIRAR